MRTGGTFEVLLHKTTRVQTRGVTSLRVGKLDAENVQIAFDKLTWLRLTSIGRTCIFTMPDGSTLQFGGPALSEDPAPGFGGLMGLFGMPSPTPSLLPPSVELRRIDEPSWFGGRATITNLGGSEVVWRHAFGVTRIGPSQRVTFFLSPPDATVKADLNVGSARVEELGDRITCHGVSATTVQWCGASIQVPAGGSVTFESLGGDFQKAAVGTNISRSPATSGAAGSGG